MPHPLQLDALVQMRSDDLLREAAHFRIARGCWEHGNRRQFRGVRRLVVTIGWMFVELGLWLLVVAREPRRAPNGAEPARSPHR